MDAKKVALAVCVASQAKMFILTLSLTNS